MDEYVSYFENVNATAVCDVDDTMLLLMTANTGEIEITNTNDHGLGEL